MDYDNLTEKQLIALKHNNPEKAFHNYLMQTSFIKYKQNFLFSLIAPKKNDFILECGSSSGKTCIDMARRSGCYALGIDFDPIVVKLATEMKDKYFPELKGICHFKKDNLTTMKFNHRITKVIMLDFTEHISDSVFDKILANIRKQLPSVLLYIYTPLRSHIFEIMKHNNLILKKGEGHINVKSEKELKEFLKTRGWKILQSKWRPSHLPLFRHIEFLFGQIPFIGKLFHRRIAITNLSINF